ncbi:MAG TPA: amidase family protein, partial [Vicinamibacterales bacterium]|nr:amidase family protein [Vicinamibacterales bacterium]
RIRALGHSVSGVPAPLVDLRKGIANIKADRTSIGGLAFADIDVLVLPTTATTTPAVKDAARSAQTLSPELTMFANYYGLPAISVPCGLDHHGLPVGVQFVAAPANDVAVLQLASQYEKAAEFKATPRL